MYMRPPITPKQSFPLLVTAISLVSFGITMVVMAAAYTSDLNKLINAPFEVWSALCGQPGDSPLILPLLITMSMLAILIGAGLLLWYGISRRRA
jgi:hypothetical protein